MVFGRLIFSVNATAINSYQLPPPVLSFFSQELNFTLFIASLSHHPTNNNQPRKNLSAEELDLIISATGVKPNISFLKDSGLKTDHGILTNANMQTNLPDVFAAGDCAQAFDAHSGNQIVSAIQPNAAEQARSAAFAMLGSTSALRRVTQINVLDTLGLISTSFGDWEGVAGGQHSELTDTAHSKHISLQFKGDLLVGSNTVGWTENVGALRGLVEGQLRLGEWKEKLLQDPTLFASAFTACSSHQDVWSGAQDERRR